AFAPGVYACVLSPALFFRSNVIPPQGYSRRRCSDPEQDGHHGGETGEAPFFTKRFVASPPGRSVCVCVRAAFAAALLLS
ncbi:MAG: hypothetical protein AAF471_09315, partial [Myxococcota bacterium]